MSRMGRPPQRLPTYAAALALVATATGWAPPPASADPPTNAGAVFKWGYAAWKDEFLTSEPQGHWDVNKPGRVTNKHGMMNIESAASGRGGTITATANDQAAAEGRWEARVRAHRYTYTGTSYTAIWELVPVSKYKCGARSIVMSSYAPDDTTATGAVRTTPDLEYSFGIDLDLSNDVFHTYAIEVTPKRISWFVDTEVVRTERRPKALSGTTFEPRFRLQAAKDADMDHTRMQMDWVRYYTLERPNAKSTDAPKMDKGTYAGACGQGTGPEPTDPEPTDPGPTDPAGP